MISYPIDLMRLSCGNDSFPVLPHPVSVELIARLGFDGYDLSLAGTRSIVPLSEVLADVAGWAGRLEERVCGRGLVFSDVFHIPANDFETMAPNHPDGAERARGRTQFRSILDLAVRLRAPGMTVLPGLAWPGESHEESLVRASQELGARAREAADCGVSLSVEPHVHSVCRTPADVMRLCELTPGLRLTLDYTHYVMQGFEESELEPLLAHARHVHVRGGDGRRLQVSLAENTVDHGRMLDALREIGYGGFVAVEYCWVDWEDLDRVDVLTETVLMRNRVRAHLAGEHWHYDGDVSNQCG